MSDYMIAAVCIANGGVLVTRNRKHFERVKELKLSGQLAHQAGEVPWTRALGAGEAARIFPGAPLPPGRSMLIAVAGSDRAHRGLPPPPRPSPA